MRTRPILAVFAAAAATCSEPSPARDAAAADGDASETRADAAQAPDAADAARPYVDPWACPAAPSPLPLDAPLDATQARAGRVTTRDELIGGEGAYGLVGHYKLYNDRVRFVVQGAASTRGGGAARPVGYGLYGGNLIDADRVRARGERGRDVFRETFPLVALRASSTDEVAVACDGSGGRPAAIRVVGTDQPTRLIPTIDALAPRRFLRIITHYVLAPGRDVLEVHTEVESVNGHPFTSLATGDFLAFGSALTLFSPLTGFDDPSRGMQRLPFVIGVGDPGEPGREVSYGVAPARGTVVLPFADESGTFAQYDDVSAPAGGRASFVRYVAVGTGDAASAAAALMAARGDARGTVTGRTTPGALVFAYARPYAAGAAVRMMARAAADGAFAMPLPPGDYDLVAVDRGRARGAAVPVTVAQGATVTANPSAGPTGTLVLDVATLGAGGGRVRAPVKVSLRGTDVEAPDRALGNLEGEREGFELHRAVYSLAGTERVAVKPGRYRATVSRGPEYDVVQADVVVPADGEATLRADLARVVDTAGYVSADFHQHTVGSVDSGRSLCNRVLENVAEGLEYAATTDHDNATDFAPCTRELALGPWFGSAVGNEISVVGVGHFNAYPLAVEPADPLRLVGAQYWADLAPQQLFDRVRAERSDPVLHVSHPRAGSLKGYFAHIGLDPTTLTSTRPLARGFEAIEVNESLGNPEEFLAANDAQVARDARSNAARIPVLRDFFALVARGERTCALGNSDTHGRNDGSGWPRNFLRVGEDAPDRVTDAMVREAIRAQRVVVSNGVFVRVRVDGAERMGWREVVRAAAGGADLEVEVAAPPWVTVRDLVVYENGRPMTLTASGAGAFDAAPGTAGAPLAASVAGAGVVRLRARVRVRPTRDSFYVFVARGAGTEPVGRGAAFGYTNPVYVDVDGGEWTPPGS